MLELFQHLRRRILNLDASVREEVKKLYIAYKATTNFVDVIPRKKRLRLSLNVRFDEIRDPKGLCRDITGIGRWGNGDVETEISSLDQLDDVMDLICQAFEKHMDEETVESGDVDGSLGSAVAGRVETDGVAIEDVRRMLSRIEIPEGQRALYEALYDAEDRWMALPELADAMGRERGELPGLLGALGRRINETPGLGRDRVGNPRGISTVLDVESPNTSGTGEWMYRMKPVLREALESERLV
jgi:predicted transport protein